MKNLIEKMVAIQSELKAPKNQYNSFGKYKYRSCEDIIEAVKPLLFANGLYMSISDKINNIGNSNYVESTVTITDGIDSISTTASARESVDKKGMDDAQQTGATSSYARKYALNGTFGIDDTKDADATNVGKAEAVISLPNQPKAKIEMLDGSNPELNTALYNIKLAQSEESLKKVWNNNKEFQTNESFLNAMKLRKAEING